MAIIIIIIYYYCAMRQKVIFNPHTSQSYEEVLADVKNMLNVEFPPVTALYTAFAPHVKVHEISAFSLFRFLKTILRSFVLFFFCFSKKIIFGKQEVITTLSPIGLQL